MSDDLMTAAEVAIDIGRSVDTVNRWRRAGWLEPVQTVTMGDSVIYLYDHHALREAHRLARQIKPGRPRKDDDGPTT